MKFYPHQREELKATESMTHVAAVRGYEGLYEVDIYGNVYSAITTNSRRKGILKPEKKNGYLSVNLYKNGKQKHCYIHRIVAEAFIPNPHNLRYVNHIDCNKHNNAVSNLEWCTQSENVMHQVKMNTHARACPVIVNGKHYNSMRQASLDIFGNTWRFRYERRKRGDAICHA